MSEVKVNKISPRTNCGTVQLGDSGDTITIPAGATITNNGTQTGFGREGSVNWQTGSLKTTTFTAASGEGYFINQGSAITMNLPAGTAGAIVAVSDYARNFSTYNLTISPNGSEKIGGVADDAKLNVDGQAATFVYVDSTKGWINVQNAEDTETGVLPAFIAATGGTVTTVCTNFKVHTFTGPGTFCVSCAGNVAGSNKVSYTVVAGGGGGGIGYSGGYCGGGGGAGGFREAKNPDGGYTASPIASTCGLTVTGAIPITVGAGGSGRSGCSGCGNGPNVQAGQPGSNSIFSTITSTGGGGGGGGDRSSDSNALNGGSGGGGGAGTPYPSPAAGTGGTGNTPPVSPAQGFNGGNGPGTALNAGGGGGGATAVGANFPGPEVGGAGGAGATSSINGSPVARAGGGGGSSIDSASAGGTGGGGAGGKDGTPGASNGGAGTANTGGGGGGGSRYSRAIGGAGGSGIVIIRYKFQ
jgi:hypothetical protein